MRELTSFLASIAVIGTLVVQLGLKLPVQPVPALPGFPITTASACKFLKSKAGGEVSCPGH